jgi:hypothetical protein
MSIFPMWKMVRERRIKCFSRKRFSSRSELFSTTIHPSLRLPGLQKIVDLSGQYFTNTGHFLQLVDGRLLDLFEIAQRHQQVSFPRPANPGNLIQQRLQILSFLGFPVVGNGEAMGLVSDPLK